MNVFLRFVHLCMGGCRHPHTYRERRTLHGADVLHFVCEDCGHAVPAIDRTADEHRRAVAEGAIHPAAVRRHPADIVTIDSGRRRARTDERRHAS